MREWNDVYDIVVVGSGAGALTAAITAQHQGLSVLVIEKMHCWGGTSAYSGGGLWVPNNFLMQQAGALDSPEEALEYMETVIDDVGPASSRARKEAYVHNVSEMVNFLAKLGFRWVRAPLYPDYYPNEKGAKTGRVLEGDVFNGKKLGAWRNTQAGVPGMPNIAIASGDAYLMPMVLRNWRSFKTASKIVGKTLWWGLTGRTPLSIGKSLTGQLMHILQTKFNTPVWLNTSMQELVIEDGRVVGIIAKKNGTEMSIQAKKAVFLAAGGFAKNAEYRQQHQPVNGDWSSASPGDTGDAIQAGERNGAALALMHEAWWGGSYFQNGQIMFSVNERALPGCILVDQEGRRYLNESTSYVDFGRKMLEHNATHGNSLPSWLILDSRHRDHYLFGMMPPGLTPKKNLEQSDIIKADTLAELAQRCGLNETVLTQSLERFNSFARHGKDEDFGRGQDIYDRYYGDYTNLPNANLAAIDKAPFYAVKFFPGDLGTKGGLLTDEHARVLDTNGDVMEGLYASGNTTASVMGQTYPGPGSTLGPACTFAYIAMNHVAQQD